MNILNALFIPRGVIPFPEINPVIFSIDIGGFDLALRWYALAYVAGIFLAWRLINWVITQKDYPFPAITKEVVDDFVTYAIIGIIIGGRLFGTLVYNWDYYSQNLLAVITPPFAGMSFHGGFLGIVVAVIIVAKKHKLPLLAFGDLMAFAAPIGLFLGRIANFINGELYGRPTDMPWAMKFPTLCYDTLSQNCQTVGEWFYFGDELARHPSQLYEAGLEGLLLFIVMLIIYQKTRMRLQGLMISVFFIGYGLARFIVEFFRQSDPQFISPSNPHGYALQFGEWGLSMGQILSLPMIFIGIAFLIYSRRRWNAL